MDVVPRNERDSPLLNSSTRALPAVVADSDAVPMGLPVTSDKPAPPSGGTFGRGSMWGTVFNTCAATLGAGALSLPHAIKGMGLVPGLVLLVIIAFATHYSIILIVGAIGATNAPSFEELSQIVFGRKTRLSVELAIIVFCFGTCIAYTTAVGDILEPLLSVDWMEQHMPWVTRKVAMVFFWTVFMLPLSFVEQMTSLQCTSLFGVLALVYLVTAVAIHFAFDAAANPQQTIDKIQLANPSKDAISATSIIMFAFTCQVNIPSLYAELNERTPQQMSRVSVRACVVCLLSYTVIGLTGYANFPTSDQGNVLNNYCVLSPSKSAFEPHPPRVILPAFIAITLTVLMAYPVNVFPCRYSLNMMLFSNTSRWTSRYRTVRHVGLTLGIAGLALLIALVVPDISVVFQLMGGTASAYVCFLMPAATAWRLRDRVPQMRTASGRAACVGLFLVGLLVGVLSTAVTIDSLFDPPDPPFNPCNQTSLNGTTTLASYPYRGGPFF